MIAFLRRLPIVDPGGINQIAINFFSAGMKSMQPQNLRAKHGVSTSAIKDCNSSLELESETALMILKQTPRLHIVTKADDLVTPQLTS